MVTVKVVKRFLLNTGNSNNVTQVRSGQVKLFKLDFKVCKKMYLDVALASSQDTISACMVNRVISKVLLVDMHLYALKASTMLAWSALDWQVLHARMLNANVTSLHKSSLCCWHVQCFKIFTVRNCSN